MVIGLATIAVVVKSQGNAVAFKQACALPGRCSQHLIVRDETEQFGCCAGCISVVDPVVAPAVEQAYGTLCASVIVLNEQCRGTACYILVGINQRSALGTRL